MRDYQTKVAVKKRWDAAPACGEACPGGLHETAKPEPRPTASYAILACKPDGKTNQKSTGSGVGTDNEIDFRRVTFTVYGLAEAGVAAAMQSIDNSFADRPDTFRQNALDFGTGAHWMRTESISETPDTIERAERTQDGQWWKGTLLYRVWTSRNK